MQSLLVWAGWPILFLGVADVIPNAELSKKYKKLHSHAKAVADLLEFLDGPSIPLFLHDDWVQKWPTQRIPEHSKEAIAELIIFASAGAQTFGALARRGAPRKERTERRVRLVENLLAIWAHYHGDPRGERNKMRSFNLFLRQAFATLGHNPGATKLKEATDRLKGEAAIPDFPTQHDLEVGYQCDWKGGL